MKSEDDDDKKQINLVAESQISEGSCFCLCTVMDHYVNPDTLRIENIYIYYISLSSSFCHTAPNVSYIFLHSLSKKRQENNLLVTSFKICYLPKTKKF